MRHADWVFFSLCTGESHSALDRLIVNVVPTILERGLHDRWFFLRHADRFGLHLRLRLRAPSGKAAELRRVVEPMCRQAVAELGVGGVLVDGCAPELARLADPPAAAAAELLFECSSQVAIDALRGGRDGLFRRLEIAAELMSVTLAAFGSSWEAAEFWRHYAARAADVAEPPAPVRAPMPRPSLPLPIAAAILLARWREALDSWAHHYRALDRPPAAEELAAHCLHLMNNRLGVSMAAEVQLARWLAERAEAA